jgi:predicted dehydrogenase
VKPLRTAILGCGGFASKHAQNIRKLPEEMKLVAFCDLDITRAASFAKNYGSPESLVFNDHHDLFKQASFDLLVVVLPPFAHSDEVGLAAERGIHLLIEKPIALTAEQAWKMVENVEKAGIRTQVGFMYRFGAAIKALREMINTGEAGPVGLVRAGYFCNHLHAPWWRFKDKSGGQVFEQAIHLVDLFRFLAGEVAEVYSIQRNLFHNEVPGGYTVEDVSGTIFSFVSGAVGVLTATNNAIPWKWTWDCKLVTQSLVADLQDSNHATITFTNQSVTGDQTVFPVETISSDTDEYMLELEDLLRAIRSGGDTVTSMREGARTLDVVLAASRSAEDNKVTRLQKS